MDRCCREHVPGAGQGWGYDLAPGTHEVAAAAVDHAGNVTTSTTTYTVEVTIASLRQRRDPPRRRRRHRARLTRLDHAARHEQHCNALARAANLRAFRIHVDIRTSRHISAETAQALRFLVDAL